MASCNQNSDSSDDDIQRPVTKSKRKNKKIISSESEEDSDFEVTSKRKVKPLKCDSDDADSSGRENKNPSYNKIHCLKGAADLTDLSDSEQSEKCAICLNKFLGQDIATPETCDHVFCLECLLEWSKNVNTCPIDRLKFNLILIRHHKEEKVIKTIYVNNSELPYNSESESNTESQVNYCDLCGEDENEGTLLLCHECQKFYHFGCVVPSLHSSSMGSWQCPACDNYVRMGEKWLLDIHRMLQGMRDRFRESRALSRPRSSHSVISQSLPGQHSSTWRLLSRVRRRFIQDKAFRNILSTSDSSDDEVDHRSAASRIYQSQVSTVTSKSRCPLMSTKRRNELYRARAQRLVSSTAATSQSLYGADSDEGYDDFRLSSPTTAPENFDVVGSILQSQTLLHSPEVLTVSRDGSLLQNLKTDANKTYFDLNSPSPSYSNPSSPKSGESSRSQSPFLNSSIFSNDTMSPCVNSAVGKQIPLHSTQNSTKYGETPRQNYSCSSTSAPRERSLSYDECILSGSAFSAGGSDQYNNDHNPSIFQKSLSCSSPDDSKKNIISNKDSNKSHHSEDEVDIYSDIESVGEEDNSLSDKLEPVKLPYNCEDSHLSDSNDVSDSTDNELVIDEDMPAEENNERLKESQNIYLKTDNRYQDEQKQDTNSSPRDTENDYPSSPVPVKSNDVYESDISNKNSYVPESVCNQDSEMENSQKNESFSDIDNQDSDMEIQEDENSVDSTQKSYQGCGSNSCSVKSSPKSLTHCENSRNEFCENENSTLGTESLKHTSNEALNCENDKISDSRSGMEDLNENNSNVSDSASQIELPYKHKKYNFCMASDRNDRGSLTGSVDSNENSQIDTNSNSNFSQFPVNRMEQDESANLQNENNSHFSFSSTHQNVDHSGPEEVDDSNDFSCADSQTGNCTAFGFEQQEKNTEENDSKDGIISPKSSENISNSKIYLSKYEQNDLSESKDIQNESVSHFGFASDQQNDESDGEDMMDSNPAMPSSNVTSSVTTETINISNDETVKSDNEYEDCDSLEEASTPCLDENLDGEIENSPQNAQPENVNQDFSRTPDYEYEMDSCPQNQNKEEEDDKQYSEEIKNQDNAVDLGIEDISEAGSEDLDEFPDEDQSPADKTTDNLHSTSEDRNTYLSAQAFEDQEEGEIIEEKPARESERKCKHDRDRYYEDSVDYGDQGPKMSISDLPRIPKLKRTREKDNVPDPLPFDNKRTSVLSRVDLGAGDVSWKRLSKHTRERSYRDGRPKDERLLYREREGRSKDKRNSDSDRRNNSKSSERRRDEKKTDKSKSDSRSRKNEKNKESDWDYSNRDKRKSHKEHRHSKERYSKDKKDKHDKSRHSKNDSKYEKEKLKDDSRYDRDTRYDKEERFDRGLYEKGKSKDKEYKDKRKDSKSESSNKLNKDHSRGKHKHIHVTESFLDKQREREVRKVDDKLKIVVEQKDKKDKLKNKDKKEAKYEKDAHLCKRESERKTFSDLTSIESKEIFAKGDSIIINVSFNRAPSPKEISSSDALDINSSEQKLCLEELKQGENLNEEVNKLKNSDKTKSSLEPLIKRPVTPPERPNQVLSVSESYWQGGDDPDDNNSATSDKSDENIKLEDENDTMESPNDPDSFTSNSNSLDIVVTKTVVNETLAESDTKTNEPTEISENLSKQDDSFVSKRRSPRSPSPPSPVDNDSYDPCEPTRSPSPPPIPAAPPLPLSNPKPPPSPELPPLPPEPEPIDIIQEDSRNILPNQISDFNISSAAVSSAAQPITVETQTPSSIGFTGMLLPPPSFLTHAPQNSNSLPNISSLLPPRTMSFQINNANIMPSNHMPPMMGGNFMPSQMHGGNTLPPPPNPPSIAHMTSVPPPPPPPSAMGLISQVRHPQLNIQPPLPPNSLLQNLNIPHNLNIPQIQLPPLPHLPPNLCAALANHQSPLPFTSQNQPTSLPCNITNQQGPRFVLAPNQIPLLPNQNMNNNKPHVMSITQMLSHVQNIPVTSTHKPEQPSKPATPAEKNEVIDMDVDSPYSPGDCSVDSVNDYSPTGSPLPSTPKESGGDIFDTLFSADLRTPEKRPHDSVSRSERSKSHSGSKSANETPSKKSKHDHRVDSKSRHSVRMQIEKNKRARKEQKLAEKIAKLDDSQLKILDELPSSAVEMQVKEKFLKKLNRQERVIEEVKLALKPYYKSRDVTKEEYKDILRRAVPKICHNKTGEINPVKVKYLVECYVKKAKHSKKKGDKKKSKFS